MRSDWQVIYQYNPDSTEVTAIVRPVKAAVSIPASPGVSAETKSSTSWSNILGFLLVALGFGGMLGPFIPALRLESAYAFSRVLSSMNHKFLATTLPPAVPVVFNPLVKPDGSLIQPVNRDFSIIVPSLGINAPIIANVDPAKPDQYGLALEQGVAHASTSFLPDENGTVYLFSHSTNYDWFVKDLNAIFYLLKNLKAGDLIVLYYQGKQYTYTLRETRVVNPSEISYLVPTEGKKSLILQTCWPPGSTTERLLLFADFISQQ